MARPQGLRYNSIVETPTELPSKLDVVNALLEQGTVFVHLDPRLEGVIVPPWHKDQPQLVLQIGLDMPVPIRDLRVDDSGVQGTLSFNHSPFYCQVSWDAVFALAGDDGRGMVWPESMPVEITAEIEREAGRAPPPEPPSDPPPTNGRSGRRELPPYLKVIK